MCRNCYGPGSNYRDEFCCEDCYINYMENSFKKWIPDERAQYEYFRHNYLDTLKQYREFLEAYGNKTVLGENSFNYLDEQYK